MKLGGNIELEGFDNIEPAQLVVVKKIVGSNAKKISETHGEFKLLKITLKEDAENKKVEGEIKIKDKDHKAEASDKNLFFALNAVFKDLTASIK